MSKRVAGVVLLLVAATGVQAGTIIWDDSHDTNDDELNGNYSLFSSAIVGTGHSIVELEGSPGAINASVLAGFDALFIMDPESGLLSAEITTIHNFVDNGGGLFVAWDGGSHTASLNNLLAPYQISLAGVNNVGSPLLSNFVPHPVVDGIGSIAFHAGSTINVAGSAISLIAGGDPSVLAVAGPGCRVVVIGDASLFKDSLIGEGDNEGLTVNIANYTVPEPAALSLLALGGLAMIRRRRK